MADVKKVAPNLCAYPDKDHENLIVEVELPGVKKDDISFKIHDDSFMIHAAKETVHYVGSYAICCPVDPSKAKAKYEEGLLTVTAPYRVPFEDAVELEIE